MRVILHPELLTAELPCGVYYYGGIYRAWYLGARGSLDLPSHALWSIDDSDPVTLYGEVTLFTSGDTFGPVPESYSVLEFDFTPPAPGTYTGTFTTDSNADVEDSFELEGVWETHEDHEINYFAGAGGTISGDTPQTVSDGGDGTPVTAVPDPGYRFVEWAEDSSTDPTRQELNVTTDLTFTAVFEAIPQYTITYTALTGGSISGDNPQTVYEDEDGTPVTAAAGPLYAFVKWIEDDNTDPERYEENVTEDKSFTALFVYLYPNGVHVKEDAAGNCDGTDWANAFNSLQEGMDFASDYGIANVLVAQGSYRPERCEDITGGPRFNTFVLHNNVRVICGYSGIGYDRDRTAYPTILSGDMGDYNVYNVIRIDADAGLDSTCILEDAIISGGRAEGAPKYPQTLTGGGIFVQSGNGCRFLNCVVRDNTAVLGGGVHITGYASTMISELLGDPDPMAPLPEPSEDPEPVDDTLLPYLEGCIFTENTARLGGGIYLSGINAASPVFTACGATFNNAVYGGGLMAYSCAGELCIGLDYNLTPYGRAPGLTVTYNKASMCGGGLFLYRSTMGCKYVLARNNNALKTGGGLLMSSLTGNTVQYCLFDSNSSPIGGGAAFTSGTVEMSDAFMVGNTAARTGAGVASSGGAVLIDRCFFKANRMVDSARNDKSGGALSSLYSRMSVYNSYFTGNRANLGSVVYTDKGSIGLTGVTVEGNLEDHRSACFHAKGTTLAVTASVVLNSNLQDGVPCGGFPGNITGQDLALSAGADTGWVTGTAVTGDPDTEIAVLTYPWDEGYSEILVPASGSPLKGVVDIAVFDGYNTDLTETLRSDPASIGAVDQAIPKLAITSPAPGSEFEVGTTVSLAYNYIVGINTINIYYKINGGAETVYALGAEATGVYYFNTTMGLVDGDTIEIILKDADNLVVQTSITLNAIVSTLSITTYPETIALDTDMEIGGTSTHLAGATVTIQAKKSTAGDETYASIGTAVVQEDGTWSKANCQLSSATFSSGDTANIRAVSGTVQSGVVELVVESESISMVLTMTATCTADAPSNI